jgi:uridine phosphorylase
MKRSDLKELIKKSMLEVSPNSGAMTPEEEKMVADYEEEEANKYALDKEEPMEEGSVILNRDEVYAKYAPLVKQYMENGLDRHAAILKAQDVLAKEYGATPLNIQSTISDYFDDQYRNSTYANEDVLREADEIVAAWAQKQTLNEEMHGGYLELLEMNPAFDEGVAKVLEAWNEWKEGDMTEPYMVEEAKQDVLAYLSSMMS